MKIKKYSVKLKDFIRHPMKIFDVWSVIHTKQKNTSVDTIQNFLMLNLEVHRATIKL